MVTNYIEDCVNAFNQKISTAYANFANTMEEIERITPKEEQYLLREKTQQIDNLYQSIISQMRPHLRRYIEGK